MGRIKRHLRIAGVCLAAFLMSGCSTINWQYNYDLGLRSAAAQRRRAVVVFTSGTNADSRNLEWKVFADAKVKEMMREFVPVRQDYYLNRSEAEELGVSQPPAVVVVRPDGSVAGSQSGSFTPESLRMFLIKNRFN